MTYDIQERSRDDGQPIELYQFSLGATIFTFTSSDEQITFGGNIYAPESIRRTEPSQSQERNSGRIVVTVDRLNTVADQYRELVPGESIGLTIFRHHLTDAANEFATFWKGFVKTVNFRGVTAEMSCEPITSRFQDLRPRKTFQSSCNHMLFDPGCQVVQSAFEENPTVSGVSGTQITLSGIPSNLLPTDTSDNNFNYFVGGIIQTQEQEFRMVLTQDAVNPAVMNVLLPFQNNPNGQIVTLLPGCDHSFNGHCSSIRFNNQINFGGSPFVPILNPHDRGLL